MLEQTIDQPTVSIDRAMRCFALAAIAVVLLTAPALSQPVATQPSADSELRITWEVKNRFRLFRNDADFQRHVVAQRAGGVLAAEHLLAGETDGRGWAKDMYERLCLDVTGKLTETCQRDGERES